MTLLAGAAIFCFYAVVYPYHLHFQEQYQLFEFTWAYFGSLAAIPGGVADWLGRFLTQLFYYAPLGAACMALLLVGIQLLTWACCRNRTLLTYALSFLPVVLLLAFYADENALAGAAVALALALAASALCRKQILLVPVLYWLCGPLAVVYVLVTAIWEGKRPWIWLFLLVILVLCPLISARLVPYPLARLFQGVHYYRYHNILPVLLWLGALGAVAVVLFSAFKGQEKWLPGLATFAGLACLGVFLTLRSADMVKEEWMRYDFMVRMKMWNRIMMTADKKNPRNPKTVSCLNLALGKTGRLPDSQFSYYQNGPEGLIPSYVGDYTNPVSTSEIFWHLGMVNTAQRYAFEAQEAIPDFQKSARLYRRLAETNIVNGDWDVARKYLKALQHTLFYRQWAKETLSLLDEDRIFEVREELEQARDQRLKEHDFLFSDTEMDSMLGLLHVENPGNDLALDYLMAWCLLTKNLDRFVECIHLVTVPVMPKSYQEALLLRWVQTHSDFTGLPPYLAPAHAQRISRFVADMQAGKSEEAMRRQYGDTYWFYYYYRYRHE